MWFMKIFNQGIMHVYCDDLRSRKHRSSLQKFILTARIVFYLPFAVPSSKGTPMAFLHAGHTHKR